MFNSKNTILEAVKMCFSDARELHGGYPFGGQ